MDPLRARNLLLVLLIPLSHQNLQMNSTAEPRHSSRSVEFCLHVPGESHWSSSKPDPPKEQTNQSKAQLEPVQTTQPVTPADPPGQTEEPTTPQPEPETKPQLVTEEKIVPVIRHGHLLSARRCRCDGKKMKLPTETSPVRSTQVWPPTENCHSPEFLETLHDGREVCVTAPSFLTYFSELVRSQQKTPSTTVPPTTTVDPTTPFPTTTRPTAPRCELCSSDLGNVSAEAVQSLSVKMHSFPCKTLIYVNLKDDNRSLCVDLDHVGFQRLLETLPSFPPDVTSKTTVNKCRCNDTDMMVTNEGQSTVVWFPSDTCNSTEYIVTLMDGSELCMAPPSLRHYFDFIIQHQPKLETVSFLDRVVLPPKTIVETELKILCLVEICPWFDWKNIDSKDVESLQMDVLFPECPVNLRIHLKPMHGRPDFFCVSSEDLWFPDVLKKLDIN